MISSKCDYHTIYACKDYHPRLIEAFNKSRMPTKDWLECLTMVFQSNVMRDMIQDYRDISEPTFCQLLIKMFDFRKLDEDDLFPFICISLSEAADVYFTDVVAIYEYYGYNNKTLKCFLHFNIEMNKTFYPILPFFICDVTKDPKTELSKGTMKMSVKYINDLLDMFTPPPEFVNRIKKCLRENPKIEDKFKSICERLKRLSVASLRELSRDAFKKVICDKLNITNTLEFYTAVNKLPIPSLLKEILAYRVPVNVL